MIQQQNGVNLYSHHENLPRIYAAATVRQVTNEAEALQIIGDPQFSGWQEAVIIRPANSEQADQLNKLPDILTNGKLPVFSGRYLSYRNNQIVAEVTTEQPMMIVFSEMYDKDWHVSINEQPTPLWQANYAFRGVLVDAGTTSITMRYKSQPYHIGFAISLITILLIISSVLYFYYRPKHSK